MNARPRRFVYPYARLACVLGLALAAGACEKALPTSAEIERMDAASLEARAAALRQTDGAPRMTYFVDDRPVTMDEARALPWERIERMTLSGVPAGGGEMRLYTNPRAEGEGLGAYVDGSIRFRADEQAPLYATPTDSSGYRMTAAERFAGLLVVDGVITDRAGLGRLAPDDIHIIEVIKGTAAARIYDDPRAANGVIRITTRAGSR
jgi:hypothetical protein